MENKIKKSKLIINITIIELVLNLLAILFTYTLVGITAFTTQSDRDINELIFVVMLPFIVAVILKLGIMLFSQIKIIKLCNKFNKEVNSVVQFPEIGNYSLLLLCVNLLILVQYFSGIPQYTLTAILWSFLYTILAIISIVRYVLFLNMKKQ